MQVIEREIFYPHSGFIKIYGVGVEEGYEGIGICQVCELDHPGKVGWRNRKLLELELKKWQEKEADIGR